MLVCVNLGHGNSAAFQWTNKQKTHLTLHILYPDNIPHHPKPQLRVWRCRTVTQTTSRLRAERRSVAPAALCHSM